MRERNTPEMATLEKLDKNRLGGEVWGLLLEAQHCGAWAASSQAHQECSPQRQKEDRATQKLWIWDLLQTEHVSTSILIIQKS